VGAALILFAFSSAPPARSQCHDFVSVSKDGVAGVDGLQSAVGVATSPDGRNVYVVGSLDDAVAAFERDAATGAVDFIDVLFDGVGGVDGLNGASGVALSPDGRHLYVASQGENGVGVFARDAETGILGFVEVLKSPAIGIDLLDGAADVVVSPDGRHVYVASFVDDAVAIFSRDTATGALTLEDGVRDGVGDVDGLDGAFRLVMSRDGHHLYVAGVTDDAVAVFSRDVTTGLLGFVEVQRDGVGDVAGLDAATSVALSPDGARLFATAGTDDALVVFDRDAESGALTFVQELREGVGGVDGLDGANDVAVSPDGLRVYVASTTENAVAVFLYRPFGVPLAWTETIRDDVGGVDGLRMALALAVDPASDRLYVVSSGDAALAAFDIPPLRFVGDEIDGQGGVDGLDAVRGVAVSPDGRQVVTAGTLDDAVSVFLREPLAGTLSFSEVHQDGLGGVDGLDNVEAVVVSPDGRSAYAAALSDDAVVAFTRDAASGALSFVEFERDGVGGVDGIDAAMGVAVSPDGKNVYATGYVDDGLAVFARNATTSALTFLEVKDQGVGGVTGLDGAREVIVSPDGKHVYVASEVSDAVAVFSRNAATGTLSFLEAETDGVGGVNGLDNVRSVALSPDGANLYAGGYGDDAIAVFARDPATGALTFSAALVNLAGGVEGLGGVSSVLVRGDGRRVYSTALGDEAVAVFARDRATGALTFLDAIRAECGATSLGQATRIAASPNGRHFYVASPFDDALAIFAPEPAGAAGALAALAALAALGRRRGCATPGCVAARRRSARPAP
jgi:6-phosphogluconolactonase (cycloisomerase 2 family)